jgi:hypothetical protein
VGVSLITFSNLLLGEKGWPALSTGRCAPLERSPDIHWTGANFPTQTV